MQAVTEQPKNELNEGLMVSGQINDQASEAASTIASLERQSQLNQAAKNLLLIAATAGIGISTYHFVSEGETPFTSSDNNLLLYNIMLGLSALGILGMAGYQCRQSNSFFQLKNSTASDNNLLNGIPFQHKDKDYIIKAIAQPTEDLSSSMTYRLGIKDKSTDSDFVVDKERPISLTLQDGEAEKITTIKGVLDAWNQGNDLEYELDSLMEDLTECLQQTNPIIS